MRAPPTATTFHIEQRRRASALRRASEASPGRLGPRVYLPARRRCLAGSLHASRQPLGVGRSTTAALRRRGRHGPGEWPCGTLGYHLARAHEPALQTLVFESGLGDAGTEGWTRLRPILPKDVQAAWYDRPGFGTSEDDRQKPTPHYIASALHAALAAANIKHRTS